MGQAEAGLLPSVQGAEEPLVRVPQLEARSALHHSAAGAWSPSLAVLAVVLQAVPAQQSHSRGAAAFLTSHLLMKAGAEAVQLEHLVLAAALVAAAGRQPWTAGARASGGADLSSLPSRSHPGLAAVAVSRRGTHL